MAFQDYEYKLEPKKGLQGFNIATYRKANMLKLYLSNTTASQTEPFFSAYYIGDFNFNVALEIGSYSSMLTGLNKLFSSGLWRSTLAGAAQSGLPFFQGFGEITGAFDAPVKPYIQATKPLEFTIDCYLPLFRDDDDNLTNASGNPYHRNIEIPINTLLKVVLPDSSEKIDKASVQVSKFVKEKVEYLFPTQTSNPGATGAWAQWRELMNAIVNNWQKDFFEGSYMLNEPIQFQGNNRIIAKIGNRRLDNVFISNVSVAYAPLIYTDETGVNAYPPSARVSLSLSTKDKAKVSSLSIGTDYNHMVDAFNVVPTNSPEQSNEIKKLQ